VAAPVLRRSPVFSDDELADLLQSVSPQHQVAIAGRARISAGLADALVSRAAEPAVAVLMGNRGADVSAPMIDRALERFGDSRAVGEALAQRRDLPAKFVARLIAQVSDELREMLVERYRIPPGLAADMMMQMRERALLGL